MLGKKEDVPIVEPEKKVGIGWVFKLILIIAIISVVIYLFLNPEGIRSLADKLFGNLLN
jgi:hypothetical protein